MPSLIITADGNAENNFLFSPIILFLDSLYHVYRNSSITAFEQRKGGTEIESP